MSETHQQFNRELGFQNAQNIRVQRKGKRRNAFIVAGSEDPQVGRKFLQDIKKKNEAVDQPSAENEESLKQNPESTA